MRAFEVRESFGIDSLAPIELPLPSPGEDEIVLKVRAVSLNYRDLLVVKGLYNPRISLPFVPLSDAAGEVVAVGERVRRVKVGDRVAGIFMQEWLAGELTESKGKSSLGGGAKGVLAEYVVLHEDGVVKFPDHLSFEEASTLPCAGVTAWHATIENGIRPGDDVLLLGTGGVSVFALQFCLLSGARVIITSSSDEKLQRARKLGAAHGINYRTAADWEKSVLEFTGGAGVDLVVEVGGAGTLTRSIKAVRTGGRISLIGVLTGASGEINSPPIIMKGIRLQGIYVGSRQMLEAMNRAVRSSGLHPVIDRVFAFEEVHEALKYMESGSHFGKICLKIS